MREVLVRFHEDRCLQLAARLTFTTLLALAPLVTVALTVVSAFPAFSGIAAQLDDFVAGHILPKHIGRTVTRHFDQFSQRAGRLTLIGSAVLAATAMITMHTIERAFNTIWRVPRHLPTARRLVMYWAVLTLGPILIGASLTITSYFVSASMCLVRGAPYVGGALLWLTPFLLAVAAFTLLYFLVPGRQVDPWHALIGGMLAGVLFELSKWGFAFYVSKKPTYAVVYGTFATIPIFLLWIYLSWVVTALGAVVVAMLPDLGHLRHADYRTRGRGFLRGGRCADCARRCTFPGKIYDLARLAAHARTPRDRCDLFLNSFALCGWAGRLAAGRWALICDPSRITLADVYRRFVTDPESLSKFAVDPVLIDVLGTSWENH